MYSACMNQPLATHSASDKPASHRASKRVSSQSVHRQCDEIHARGQQAARSPSSAPQIKTQVCRWQPQVPCTRPYVLGRLLQARQCGGPDGAALSEALVSCNCRHVQQWPPWACHGYAPVTCSGNRGDSVGGAHCRVWVHDPTAARRQQAMRYGGGERAVTQAGYC